MQLNLPTVGESDHALAVGDPRHQLAKTNTGNKNCELQKAPPCCLLKAKKTDPKNNCLASLYANPLGVARLYSFG